MTKKRTTTRISRNLDLANHEIVTLAAFIAGAQYNYTDTEDIALKANEIAPGRFSWRKYKDQINIDTVRKRLWDAARPDKCGYLIGSERNGWLLTEKGRRFAEENITKLEWIDLSKTRLSKTEQIWFGRERVRMMAEPAFLKFESGKISEVTAFEAERFFRIDDYVVGDSRRAKIERAKNAFVNDENLRAAIEALSELVREK